MPELRIILLVLGVVFVAAIAGFEWWRSRGQRPASASLREEPQEPVRFTREERAAQDRSAREERPARDDREDLRSLPEINVVRESEISVTDTLPVIELSSTSATGTRRALGISISDDVAVDRLQESAAFSTEPTVAPAPRPAPAPQPPPAAPIPGEELIGSEGIIGQARVIDPMAGIPVAPKLQLVWPPEAERRIVTLRVTPKVDDRFSGRNVRQAFSGCGFQHGPLDIFHLPDQDGRVLISAAALAQPGTFDPSIMDSQRFSGLNLFAVLPGPIPEREVFEELVHASRQLAERLNGMITDQHGEELTSARIARLRQSLDGQG